MEEDRIRRTSTSDEDEKQLGAVASVSCMEKMSPSGSKCALNVILHIYLRNRKAVVSQMLGILDASHHLLR